MAYGNVLGYTPGPAPGSYAFQQANGQNILLSGPPAESLKARLDASAGMAPQPVAGPGGGAPNDTVPEGSVMFGSGALNTPAEPPPPPVPAPVESVQPAPAMSVPPPAVPPPANFEQAPPPQLGPTVESAASAPPPAPMAHPVMVGGVNTGLVQGPDGRLYKPTPGIAAVTQAQLQAKAAQGVATPHSASESVSGGFAPSEQFLSNRHALAEEKGKLIDETAGIEAQNAAREKQIADEQFKMAAQARAEEQARTDQIAAQVQKDLETKDRFQKEFANAKVDPRRLFSGHNGTAMGVLGALAAGLGAAGSGMLAMGGHPGQPNLGYQAVQSAIDRDVAAQENEIKVKGELANNALTQYQRSGLTLEQAKSALRSAQLGWANAQLMQSAATTKGSMVSANANAMKLQLLGGINDADEQYRQQSLGTATKSIASTVAYPHAGSAGGLLLITPDKAIEVGEKSQESAGKDIENAQHAYNLAHPKAGIQAKQAGLLADNEAAQQQLIKAAATAGLRLNEKGEFEGSSPGIIKEGTGSFHKDYTNSLQAAAPLVLKAIGSNRLSAAEQEAWAKQGKSMSGEQNKQFLQGQLESLKAKERAIRAGGGGATESAPAAPAEGEGTE